MLQRVAAEVHTPSSKSDAETSDRNLPVRESRTASIVISDRLGVTAVDLSYRSSQDGCSSVFDDNPAQAAQPYVTLTPLLSTL